MTQDKSAEAVAEELMPLYAIHCKYFQGSLIVDDVQYEEKILINGQIIKDRIILTQAILAEREKVNKLENEIVEGGMKYDNEVIKNYRLETYLSKAREALINLIKENERREDYFRRRIESPIDGPEICKELWDEAKQALEEIKP